MLLDYQELSDAMSAAGVPLAAERLVDTAAEAVAAAASVPGPVVMKLISRSIVHKADVGAVILGIDTDDDASAAAARLEAVAAAQGLADEQWRILVQQMVDTRRPEVFIGLKHDETFGPVIVVGAGGGLVEIMPERAIAACPLTVDEARELLRGLAIGTALGEFRGNPDVTGEVAEVIAAASTLPQRVPGLTEADLNPLVVTDRGPLVVDVRMAVDPAPADAAPAEAYEVPDLTPLLEPESLVLIGASATALQPGNRVLGYLRQHGYPGRVTVVHPTAAEIDGYPAVPSIADVEAGSVDLACIVVPARSCAEVLAGFGEKGVRAAVVMSSGFSEVGADEAEAELGAVARRYGIALCGPNTVGVMSPGSKVQVSFSQAQSMAEIPSGRVALIAQSGALGGSLSSQAAERGIGLSHFISVGNQATLQIADYIDHLAGTDTTDTIAVVVEGVDDGRRLLDAIARARAGGKAVLILKVGRTAVGARAVQSHTGSVAGDYAVYRSLLTRAGATPIDTITELLDALALRDIGAGLDDGARLGVVSTSGGACSMIADLATREGFEVPVFGERLRTTIGEILPSYAAIANPVDVTGRVTADPSIYGKTLEVILASAEVDAVAVLVTTVADPMAEELAAQIAGAVAETDKPVLVAWTIAAELAPKGLGLLREAGIPVFDDPARMIRAARLAGAARTTR
ncbi:MAG: acetate--CoA ligase family protein [Gordonia sp. (in: high G+C Gram-positive bacteria)]|uniref:acetate--CoA ligase family protein n=1 Tax=Gordonia sp. (in: high G+C Gram-positive bacteria) TaxID=84139 RepID=UPI0039E5D4B7